MLLVAVPAAAAADPALDEYTLDLPGTRADGGLEAGTLNGGPEGPYSRHGIAGENEDATSPLGAAASSILGSSPGVALLIAAAVVGGLLAIVRLRPLGVR